MFHSFVAYAAMGRYLRYRVGATLAVDRRLATDLAAACLAEVNRRKKSPLPNRTEGMSYMIKS